VGGSQGLDVIRFFSIDGVWTVWMHNLRVIALATIIGAFSFGVLGMIVMMLPFVMIGYFMGVVGGMGLSPMLFLTAFILPHGVLEIPAIIIAGAAILNLGATLATPAKGSTIGEAWLNSFAEWTRILLAVVMPLFLAAAALEVFVTPQVVITLLGN
jgi:uncharacterized membrane protein SpoIIM required for sporulation